MLERLRDYFIARIGLEMTFYLGVPLFISVFCAVLFAAGWCFINFVLFVNEWLGGAAAAFTVIWTAWTGFYLFARWFLKD